jgi:hypothetical protein
LIPNPIRKALFSIQKHRVRALLMGGQACVLYGAAEFSRDIDLAILADPRNLSRLRKALADLQAELIAVPPFHSSYLLRGHAIHFRCLHPEAARIRIDIMAKMRGLDSFPNLWNRRMTVVLPENLTCHVMSLPDLVKAKKTQRDKDWPMIRRLLEAHYFEYQSHPTWSQTAFWFRELRTPELLHEIARRYPRACRRIAASRPLLFHALSGNLKKLAQKLSEEMAEEREKDRLYWLPLRKELDTLRHSSEVENVRMF